MPDTADPRSAAIEHIAESADAFLKSLDPQQRETVVFAPESPERLDWDYRPRERAGLPLARMDSAQQRRALALLASALSAPANVTALNIMSLEHVLGRLEGSAGRHRRDPELYFVTFFGKPAADAPWGWRFEGHHLSVNVFVSDGAAAVTPNFFGANPARIPDGPLQGFRTLPQEEDAARSLLSALDAEQQRSALIAAEAPADIVSNWAARARLDDPVGLAFAAMNAFQQQSLRRLIQVYAGRLSAGLADRYLNAVEKEGTGYIHFAWAGSVEPGRPHYYRLHGPSFLVEYDNTQNDANHIHSVWRDLQRDWGEDLLQSHYRRSHG